jgi:hypothetical protein
VTGLLVEATDQQPFPMQVAGHYIGEHDEVEFGHAGRPAGRGVSVRGLLSRRCPGWARG